MNYHALRQTLTESVVRDAPNVIIAEAIREAFSRVSEYNRACGDSIWPKGHSYVAGITMRVRTWIENGEYRLEVTMFKTGEVVWEWRIKKSEARIGWPYLSAAPEPILLRHDEVAA